MKKVVLYTSKTCGYCRMAKDFLLQNKIHYTERDINLDNGVQMELSKRNIRGVPTFQIGDEFVVGFDKEKVLKLVDHRLINCDKCEAKVRVPINKEKYKIKCPKCGNLL